LALFAFQCQQQSGFGILEGNPILESISFSEHFSGMQILSSVGPLVSRREIDTQTIHNWSHPFAEEPEKIEIIEGGRVKI